jgi:hypothetical protein
MLVFASAPYAALIYRPFGALPYPWAYVTWLGFSMALYAAALVLLLRSTALRRHKYVDAGSFFHLLFGNAAALAQALAIVAAVTGLAILAAAWWRSSEWSAASRDLLWAAPLAGALVANVCTPICDTILVGPAVALAAGVKLRRDGKVGRMAGSALHCPMSDAIVRRVLAIPALHAGIGWVCVVGAGRCAAIGGNRGFGKPGFYLPPNARVNVLCRLWPYEEFRALLKCFPA